MNPIKDIKDVHKHWDIFEQEKWSLYAFFLYTDEDRNMAAYVRENFNSLDELSGENCLIFLIDEPAESWRKQAHKRAYWSEFQFRTQVWEGFTESRPYDKSKAYAIGRSLGISPDQLPCIVFFRSIEDRSLLVFPLDAYWSIEDLSKAFREVFSLLQEVEVRFQSYSLDDEERRRRLRPELWNSLKAYIQGKKTRTHVTRAFESPLVRTIGELVLSVGGSLT